jgi:hypothetical protein
MGGACGTYGGGGRCIQGFGGENRWKETNLKIGKIILKRIFKKWEGHGLD